MSQVHMAGSMASVGVGKGIQLCDPVCTRLDTGHLLQSSTRSLPARNGRVCSPQRTRLYRYAQR
ncbi:hypothetical protein CFAM422_006396 [Trichoderma lentiforme]|uniref:Uncharacterized protein n=1 Tax=Trichoderma lentiforme TaxID=1567552 RepID=A0A9P4XDV1_9HYPO|nr:hypothetical protein CFAM422_006396 [Trichoderma lentiforme]